MQLGAKVVSGEQKQWYFVAFGKIVAPFHTSTYNMNGLLLLFGSLVWKYGEW